MNATNTNTYEVRNYGSDVWRPATEAEIAQAMRTLNKCHRWEGYRMTRDWTCVMGLAGDMRQFRCTAN
jgi:hypothetical protein